MRTIYPLALVLPLLFASAACGRGFSESPDGGPGPGDDSGPGPGDDGGSPDGGGCGAQPGFACSEPCGGGYTEPECVDGTWQCPEYGGVDCIEDGGPGPDACSSYPPFACAQKTGCTGVSLSSQPECENGNWTCVSTGECDDAEAPDAWPPPYDDGGPSLFACGDQACDPTQSYCQILTGGPVNPDGGPSSGYACISLPGSCTPGAAASCDCVQAWEGVSTCSCIAENGDVIMTCYVP